MMEQCFLQLKPQWILLSFNKLCLHSVCLLLMLCSQVSASDGEISGRSKPYVTSPVGELTLG